jgi:hypothetical protein
MGDEFSQYNLTTDDGSALTVDVVDDQVYIRQTSMGTIGRGPSALTPTLAHELARQVEQAATVAANFRPPAISIEEATSTASGINESPAMEQVLRQLGPNGIATLVAYANAHLVTYANAHPETVQGAVQPAQAAAQPAAATPGPSEAVSGAPAPPDGDQLTAGG